MTTTLPAAPETGPVAAGSYAARPSVVDAGIDVVSVEVREAAAGLLAAVTTITIDPTEPVFAGHYPDFPIFPGVCVVECVQRSALAVAERRGMAEPRLLAVESTRFLGAVYPGDLLTVRLELRDHEGAVRCRATASTARGDAASVRLRLSGKVAA
jgi:3-hydroxyacyl-[acyl-carrier-protein] dehydratase